jgi:hypothetical protein
MTAAGRFLSMALVATLALAACVTPPVTPPVETPIVPTTVTPTTTPEVTPVTTPPVEEFVATEELKKRTFDEVQAVIDSLDTIIAAGDYARWLDFLTADYVGSRSSEAFLKDASSAAVLKKNNIELKTLGDYFQNVVVRSHLHATLADITFVDATHVKAYTRIQGKLYILYYLVHEDGRWKIGVLPTGET